MGLGKNKTILHTGISRGYKTATVCLQVILALARGTISSGEPISPVGTPSPSYNLFIAKISL